MMSILRDKGLVKIQKTKAFTFSELIVVLLLTVVVVGLAFSVLSFVQQHFRQIRTNYEMQTSFRQLETALWIDVNRYPQLAWNAKEQTCVLTSPIDTIAYHFGATNTIRDKDTFLFSVSPTMYFKGQITNDALVDGLALTLEREGIKAFVFVSKELDAKTQLNKWDSD